VETIFLEGSTKKWKEIRWFFDINILVVIFSFGPKDYIAILGLFTMVITLIIGIAILVYLLGDVQYEFK